MPRLPDQQQAWFHHPHHHQPTGHQRSYSYHVPQPQQQPPPQPQPQPLSQQINHQAQPQRPSPPGFNNSADISPLSTSNSTSPVSPKNYHGRQVRPLYMPAVLRPTEYPSSPALPKASPGAEEVDDDERVVRSSGSFTSLSGILSLSRLSRRSTGDSGKVVDWDWDMSNYPKVDGQPTRRHWKVSTMLSDAMRHQAQHKHEHEHEHGRLQQTGLHPTWHPNVSARASGVTCRTFTPKHSPDQQITGKLTKWFR